MQTVHPDIMRRGQDKASEGLCCRCGPQRRNQRHPRGVVRADGNIELVPVGKAGDVALGRGVVEAICYAKVVLDQRGLVNQSLHSSLAQVARDRVDLDPLITDFAAVLQDTTTKDPIEVRRSRVFAFDFEVVDRELLDTCFDKWRLSGN